MLTVISLNVWGLAYVSKRRQERISALATTLRATTADVVLLQEVWVDTDAVALAAAAKAAGLEHAIHFRSAMFGSGLLTLSRHPIKQLAFWAYNASGGALDIHQGDFYAGKGVGWVRLGTPGGEVDVINTHTHANYEHLYRPPPPAACRNPLLDPEAQVPGDSDAATRIAQVLELSQAVCCVAGVPPGSSQPGPRPMIVGGDLNAKPGTLEHLLWRQMVPWLKDTWTAAAARDSPEGNPDGLTSKAPGNTFAPRRQVPQRIDYIFTDLPVTRAAVAWTHKTSSGCSLSDHFAVQADLQPGGARGGKAAAKAAAAASPGEAAGLEDKAARTALFGAAALLEEGLYAASSNAALKTGIGGCLAIAVLYSALAVPYFMPWVRLQGWLLSVSVLGGALLVLAGVLVVLAGRVGDLAQQRALVNAYKQLRAFIREQDVQLIPEGGGEGEEEGQVAAAGAGQPRG